MILDDLKKLFAPVRLYVNPRWREGGFTHAQMPKDLPLHLGRFETVEDVYCPIDKGVLTYPNGKVVIVSFVKEPGWDANGAPV